MVGVPSPGPSAAGLLVPQWLLIGTSFVVLLARVNLRLGIQRVPLMLSDYLLCCAWLCSVVTASFDIVFARMGALDPDIDYFLLKYEGSPEDLEYLYKMQWISQFPFDMTIYFAKAALLTLYLRLFPVFMRKRRFVLWAVVAYCAVAYLVTELTSLLICRPVEANWSLDPELSCSEYAIVVGFLLGWAFHFSTDVLIFIVPFMVLSQLQMKRTVKAGVYCTFLLGLITIAFSLTRFLTLYDASLSRVPSLSLVELWCALDCNISVLVACLPSLRPYFSRGLWRGYLSNQSGPGSNKITSGKYSDNGGLAPVAPTRRGHHPFEAGMTFSEEDYPYAGPRPGATSPGAKLHQLWTKAGGSSGDESPLDHGGKKTSIGDSDIELLVQKRPSSAGDVV